MMQGPAVAVSSAGRSSLDGLPPRAAGWDSSGLVSPFTFGLSAPGLSHMAWAAADAEDARSAALRQRNHSSQSSGSACSLPAVLSPPQLLPSQQQQQQQQQQQRVMTAGPGTQHQPLHPNHLLDEDRGAALARYWASMLQPAPAGAAATFAAANKDNNNNGHNSEPLLHCIRANLPLAPPPRRADLSSPVLGVFGPDVSPLSSETLPLLTLPSALGITSGATLAPPISPVYGGAGDDCIQTLLCGGGNGDAAALQGAGINHLHHHLQQQLLLHQQQPSPSCQQQAQPPRGLAACAPPGSPTNMLGPEQLLALAAAGGAAPNMMVGLDFHLGLVNGINGMNSKPLSASLYIKNLPNDADKLFLYERFCHYGAILSVKVLTNPDSGACCGVGFVNYAEHASAMRAVQALHGTKVGDKLLHVSLQMPRMRAPGM